MHFSISKRLLVCCSFSFLAWGIPFFGVLFQSEQSGRSNVEKINFPKKNNKVVEDIFSAYESKDNKEAFRLIFLNNAKVEIINVIGGMFLGIGTLLNLVKNGLFSANLFSSLHYNNGMSWDSIVNFTAPHSFEMLGIWLSGGVGFYIAILIYKAMNQENYPKLSDYKVIGMGILVSLLLILSAAYVEAYVSTN